MVFLIILLLSTYTFAHNPKEIATNVILKVLPNKKIFIESKRNYINIEIKNNLNYSLDSKNNYFLSYHLLDTNGKVLKWDNIRTDINIKPHSKKLIKLNIDPLAKGNYYIQIDIVKEDSFWSCLKRKKFIHINGYFDDYKKCTKDSDKTCWYIEDEENINKLSFIIQRTLKSSEKKLDNIRVKGFSAGDRYSSQIWARDSYTILQFSKYLYSEPFLSSWLFYLLDHKKQNGLIFDWFDDKGNFDKNTVETDQESSLALAYFELLKIDRKKYIDKLDTIEKLLENVIKLKQDKNTGLIFNAHTIDWGDVQYGASTWKEAVYLNNRSYLVVGIYTNALFYSAVEKLTNEYKNINKMKYLKWKKIQNSLKTNINKYLWNEKNGFYRLHYHLSKLKHPFNEDNMFGMGGNAVALSTSLVTAKMARSIIKTAIMRQKLFNFSTISGVLLPPYPKNYYKFKTVNDFFKYQNGGQWDWFGARLIKQMFKHGFEKVAFIKLKEIAAKNVQNKGIYEWDTMIGNGRGSSNYAGAAGALGNAIVEGLFGIFIDNNTLIINQLNILRKKFLLNLKLPQTNREVIFSFDGKCYNLLYKGFDNIDFRNNCLIKIIKRTKKSITEKKYIQFYRICNTPKPYILPICK